jgi:hypothetical protein
MRENGRRRLKTWEEKRGDERRQKISSPIQGETMWFGLVHSCLRSRPLKPSYFLTSSFAFSFSILFFSEKFFLLSRARPSPKIKGDGRRQQKTKGGDSKWDERKGDDMRLEKKEGERSREETRAYGR